ncbi:sigma-70 family RNA polymerase sigma factor [Clostridioides mangenotii]|uniref:sigma-70 family RNA polymerase sigma factor n=1 Tax=Metaclostridioides mangenotii TaxID=1540 RepID=UPI001C10EBD9|nr:sigma-70 family RNA polymerase sigma factor [Clostridioides mangenotii]MBU5306900.1 sigma-70 family RNA polymerase sigma factor [Clostridioides mangenotii]
MKIDENNFISELRNKNEKALYFVIDNYGWIIKSTVKKSLYNLIGHQEECINDVLLAVWDNIDSFDEEKNSFKNWLAAISKYKAIDYQRKYLKNLKDENIENTEIASTDNLLEKVLEKEVQKSLEKLLTPLKPEDKQIFLMVYLEEKDLDEVSKELGLTKSVIYNRLSRGRKKLKTTINNLETRRI